MNKFMSVLGVSLCLALCAAADGAPANGRALYRWVDSKGEVHYGDRIPPEYAAQETQVINSRGVEIEHVEAQKSAEQQAVDDQKKAAVQSALNRDRNLLTAYGSVAEIERLRDTRVALISDQIKVRSDFLDTLSRQMKKLSNNSMHFRPYSDDPKAPPMTDQAAQDLVHLGTDIHTQQQNLRQLHGDETNMKQQFESDIARFKELKHIQ